MSWHPIPSVNEDALACLHFTFDQRLAPNVVQALGILACHPASNHLQVVLTQDRELLAHRTLDPHGAAVIVVLPASIDIDLLTALTHALPLLCSLPQVMESPTFLVNNDGRFTVAAGG